MGAVTITRTADPVGVTADGSFKTTYTAANVSIGAGQIGRVVVVVIGKEVLTVTVSSVTINNGLTTQTMTLGAGTTFGNNGAWLYYLPVDGGATAEVVVTWSGAITNVQNHISVYTVYNGRFPPRVVNTFTSTDMDSSIPLTTGSQTINTNGGALAAASCAADTVAKTWANITEDLDEDAGDFRWTTASRVTALAATAMTCTGGTNAEDGVLVYMIVDEATSPPEINTQPPIPPAGVLPRPNAILLPQSAGAELIMPPFRT